MKKYLLLIFLLPAFAFSGSMYERTPTGTLVTSPVTFGFSGDDFELDSGCSGFDGFGIEAIDFNNGSITYFSNEYSPSSSFTAPYDYFTINIPAGVQIGAVYSSCYSAGSYVSTGTTLEGDESYVLFTIDSPPAPAPLSENAQSLYLFLSDFLPQIIISILFISLAVGVAFKNLPK